MINFPNNNDHIHEAALSVLAIHSEDPTTIVDEMTGNENNFQENCFLLIL